MEFQYKLEKSVEFINHSSIYERKNQQKLVNLAIRFANTIPPEITIKKLIQQYDRQALDFIPVSLQKDIQNLESSDDNRVTTNRLWSWLCSSGRTELKKTRSVDTLLKVIRPFCDIIPEEKDDILLSKQLNNLLNDRFSTNSIINQELIPISDDETHPHSSIVTTKEIAHFYQSFGKTLKCPIEVVYDQSCITEIRVSSSLLIPYEKIGLNQMVKESLDIMKLITQPIAITTIETDYLNPNFNKLAQENINKFITISQDYCSDLKLSVSIQSICPCSTSATWSLIVSVWVTDKNILSHLDHKLFTLESNKLYHHF
mmetsp:Transcript_50791/g.65037  ORF Transcript_50791/g.65037 Transcript_50791/m.65037 type:complete len:315 (+) Transcript_50791:49-993(+)